MRVKKAWPDWSDREHMVEYIFINLLFDIPRHPRVSPRLKQLKGWNFCCRKVITNRISVPVFLSALDGLRRWQGPSWRKTKTAKGITWCQKFSQSWSVEIKFLNLLKSPGNVMKKKSLFTNARFIFAKNCLDMRLVCCAEVIRAFLMEPQWSWPSWGVLDKSQNEPFQSGPSPFR